MINKVLRGLILIVFICGLFQCKNTETGNLALEKADNGTIKRVTLDNELEVMLNAGSSISYDTLSFISDGKIQLTGEASFNLKKESELTIETVHAKVKSSKGSFNIRSWGKSLYLECYGGKVFIHLNEEIYQLSKYQSINFINGKLHKKTVVKHQVPKWGFKVFKFYDEEMNTVYDEIERQFEVDVDHANDTRLFNGSFDKKSLLEAMKSVAKNIDIRWEISEDRKSVIISK